jgi:transcriptional regulator with XRE-family HTH domain
MQDTDSSAGSRGSQGSGSAGVMTMGLLIRQCRRAADLTQRQLAEAAGVSVAAVRDLEQGRTACPRWGTVENLAGVLGLSSRQRAELLRAWRQPGQRGPRPDVRIDVLGPLVATRFGRPVALGSVRQRAVLGLLVLHQDTWVHRDAIIELLWGERPPPSAVAEVLGYVNRLRGQLDPMRDRGERAGLISSEGAATGSGRTRLASTSRSSGAMPGGPTRPLAATRPAAANSMSRHSPYGAMMRWPMST